MRTTLAAAAAAVLAAAGCSPVPPVRDSESLSGPLSEILVRRPPAGSEGEIMLLAGFAGTLHLGPDCVTVSFDHDGTEALAVFYSGTTIGRDSSGLYLRDRETEQVFRHGDAFSGGGGFMPLADYAGDWLVERPSKTCLALTRGQGVSINPGMRHRRTH